MKNVIPRSLIRCPRASTDYQSGRTGFWAKRAQFICNTYTGSLSVFVIIVNLQFAPRMASASLLETTSLANLVSKDLL